MGAKRHPKIGARSERPPRAGGVVGNRVRGTPIYPVRFSMAAVSRSPSRGAPRKAGALGKGLHGNRSPMGNRGRVGGVRRRRRRAPDALRARRAEGLPRASRSPDGSLSSAAGAMRPRCWEIRSKKEEVRVKTRRTVPSNGRPSRAWGNAARPAAPWKTARAVLRSPNTVYHGAGRAGAESRNGAGAGNEARCEAGNRRLKLERRPEKRGKERRDAPEDGSGGDGRRTPRRNAVLLHCGKPC